MIISKFTHKAQTTLPEAVREALNLQPGDEIAYAVTQGRAVMTRFNPMPAESGPFALFAEWLSDEDVEAYRSLGT